MVSSILSYGIGTLIDKPEPSRDTVHVRVDREVRSTEREEQHARGGLRADSCERDEQIPERLRAHADQRVVVERDPTVSQLAEDPADAHRFGGTEAAAIDRLRERRQRRVRDVIPRWKARPQVRVGAVTVRVARVLRQHSEDQLVERRKTPRRRRRAVDLSQAKRDRAKTTPHPVSIGNGSRERSPRRSDPDSSMTSRSPSRHSPRP